MAGGAPLIAGSAHGAAAFGPRVGDETQLMPSWMLPVDPASTRTRDDGLTAARSSRPQTPPPRPYWEDVTPSGPIPVPLHQRAPGKPPRRWGTHILAVILALLLIGCAVGVGWFVHRTVAGGATAGTTTTATTTGDTGTTTTTKFVGQVPIPTITTESSTTDTTEANRIDPAEVMASSSLPRTDTHSYDAQNLLDAKLATAWNEDAPGDGEGEWVRFGFAEIVTIGRIDIANGYQSDKTTYANNPRVRELRLTFSDGSSQRVQLKDEMGYQTITLEPKKTEWLRMTIVSTYPGEKWADAALSEVRLYGAAK
jgi:hypothetical protein